MPLRHMRGARRRGRRKDRGATYLDGGGGQCQKNWTKCAPNNVLQFCEDGTIYQRACKGWCENFNQTPLGCQWVQARKRNECVCRKKDSGGVDAPKDFGVDAPADDGEV